MIDAEALHHLAIALALGLAVGIERGWHQRDAAEGTRVAGVRTFALSGLLGGLAQLLSSEAGSDAFLPVAFVLFVGLLAIAYASTARDQKVYGLTTEIAGLVTFVVGALAVAGRPLVAAAATVAVLALLRSKAVLHGWVSRLDSQELRAGITLALISVVALPLLPREPVDPWRVVSLYEVWWMVVLVAALSFAGYAAVQILGPRRGLLATALLGGLVSSTAVTLSYSRFARSAPDSTRLFAAGVVGACAIMPLRVLVVATVIHPPLLARLAVPLVAMAAATAIGMVVLAGTARKQEVPEDGVTLRNPLDLAMALKMGLVLVVVLLLAEAVRRSAGDAGVLLLAAISGLTDVDAITLSLSRFAREAITVEVATLGIVVAAAANTLVKAVLAGVLGGRRMALDVAVPLGAAVLTAGAGLLAAGWTP